MIAIEVVAAVVLLGMAAATAWMAIVGLIGITGGLRLKRCRSCGHLQPTSAESLVVCPYCRHDHLLARLPHARLHHYLPREW